jgi:hypothetical protein
MLAKMQSGRPSARDGGSEVKVRVCQAGRQAGSKNIVVSLP